MKKFAVFYSGLGRGAKEIINDYVSGYIKPELGLVFTTKPNTNAYEIAQNSGIPVQSLNNKDFNNNNDFEQEILKILISHQIDYVFLAGYGLLIGEVLLDHYKSKIVNIHPSLLPSFTGHKNGLQQALDYGVKIVGITTHVVDEGMDTGKILYQESIFVEEEEDFKQLEYRIFKIGTILQVKTINKYFI